MTSNPPQNQPLSLTKTTESPPQNSLLPDPTPNNHRTTAASSDSALSSDSSYERLLKKTRDLPNLSDCHSCGSRINHTNPNDRLQTLASFWRIVLLCRKCTRRVSSAQLCSYCLSDSGDKDCYRCRSCERKVHKECVLRYKALSPWCYCNSELGFSVCVDCWVPKLMESSVRVYKRRTRKRLCLKGNLENGNNKNLENVAKDVLKKNAVASKAKENALRKVVVAKRAMELANNALELVSKKSKNGPSESDVARVVDDAELAFQLHRAMNSSPRISRSSSCMLNSTCLSVPKNLDFGGNSFGSQPGLTQGPDQNGSQIMEVCPHKKNGDTNAPVSELAVYVRRYGKPRCSFLRKFSTTQPSKVYVRRAYRGPCSRLNYVKRVGLVYTRKGNKNKKSREIGRLVDGKCENVDGNGMVTESQTTSEPDGLQDEFHCNNVGNCTESSCDRNNGALHDGKNNQMPDRYILKYSKRSFNLKARKKESCDEGSKAKAEGMSQNCSQECIPLPSASVQVSSVAVEASGCLAGHQNMPPALKSYSRQKNKKKLK